MRVVSAHLIVGDPNTDEATECPECGFDAVLGFPVSLLTEVGVSSVGSVYVCARCYDEEDA